MSIEEAIREFSTLADFYKDRGNMKDAVDHQQIANWLQELKERREKEQRGIECRKPFMTVNVDEDMVQSAIDRTLDSMYMVCDHCGHKMYPKRKEEES